ncbi:cellulose synthase [Burkholderia multivorans]|uniref:cellulose synthase n=1 Tax=Burkholderia multivorans TaxID=87883 RepID=UPI00345F0984
MWLFLGALWLCGAMCTVRLRSMQGDASDDEKLVISMTKQKLTILAVAKHSGISKKTNKEFDIRTAHCVLTQHSDERGEEIIVGTINLPPQFKDIQPGDYLAEFLFGAGFGQDQGRLVPQIIKLTPFGPAKPQPKAA